MMRIPFHLKYRIFSSYNLNSKMFIGLSLKLGFQIYLPKTTFARHLIFPERIKISILKTGYIMYRDNLF